MLKDADVDVLVSEYVVIILEILPITWIDFQSQDIGMSSLSSTLSILSIMSRQHVAY